MLKTLNDAKAYALDRVAQIAGEELSETEKILIEFSLEDAFYGKLEFLITEEELEEAQVSSEEELEGFLFHKIPNYVTLLEETTAEFLAEYL